MSYLIQSPDWTIIFFYKWVLDSKETIEIVIVEKRYDSFNEEIVDDKASMHE